MYEEFSVVELRAGQRCPRIERYTINLLRVVCVAPGDHDGETLLYLDAGDGPLVLAANYEDVRYRLRRTALAMYDPSNE